MSQQLTVSHQGFDIPVELHFLESGEGSASKRPALLLIHDRWGVDDFTRAAAARLAEQGYAVVLPDLFARKGAPADDSEVALQDFLFGLSNPQIIGDALSSLAFLTELDNVDKKSLGVLGWGWGGGLALMCAGHDARVRAVADIGGDVTYPVLSANRSGSPLNFIADIEGAIFAAFAEQGAQPGSEIIRLREQLMDHDKLGEVKIFAGTHDRFWREDTPQAALLWRRIEQFFAVALGLGADALFADGGKANEESRLHA